MKTANSLLQTTNEIDAIDSIPSKRQINPKMLDCQQLWELKSKGWYLSRAQIRNVYIFVLLIWFLYNSFWITVFRRCTLLFLLKRNLAKPHKNGFGSIEHYSDGIINYHTGKFQRECKKQHCLNLSNISEKIYILA